MLRRRVRVPGGEVELLLDAAEDAAALEALAAAERAAAPPVPRGAQASVPQRVLVPTGGGWDAPPRAPEAPGPCHSHVLRALRRRVEIDLQARAETHGRGPTADRAVAALAAAGPCLVDADGAVAVRGRWPVGVESEGGVLTLEVTDGGVATHGRPGRRGRRGARSAGDLLRATVIARTAAEADVLARVLLAAGTERARREADAAGVPTVLVTAGGRTVLAGGLR